MSYENVFKLKIYNDGSIKLPFCEKCNEFRNGKFCNECGSKLIKKEAPINGDDIIDELRNESEEIDYALEEPCIGDNVDDIVQEFSKKYPELIFQLDISWDTGSGEIPSRYYFKNGVKQDATPKVEFDKPNF